MAKVSGQKTKLLHLAKILLSRTDEEHPMSIPEMISALSAEGISAERKSLYSDLEELSLFGLSIEKTRGKRVAYYVASRPFELVELKLLVDAVQSSKFLTERKSRSLITKLESLTSTHQASELARQVYVSGRIKTMNESIYYIVDEIHRAISQDRKISFLYYRWDVDKKQVLRRDGARYVVSPFALTWDDENYYLVAFDDARDRLLHFRVDKMLRLRLEEERRQGAEEFSRLDPAVLSRKVFGMFGGQEETVTLRLHASLIGVVLDRFGQDTVVLKDAGDSFRITVSVQTSPQFFGWLSGLGEQAVILSPESARQAYREHLSRTLAAQTQSQT